MGLTMLNRGRPLFPKFLSAADADYDCRDIFHIDEGVEVFRARQIGKVDDAVGHLRDFTAHFFPRAQVQLHRFASAALKDAGDGRISLQSSFFLSKQTRTGYGCDDHY
jgi:hypothetical protein